MTTNQIRLVRRSFEMVEEIADVAAALFYSRLFEADPSLRPMFRGDMKEQGRKLMRMLAIGVTGLGQLETIVPALEEMGRRHASYGVRDQHYSTVRAALLWTLKTGLGEAFTGEVEQAWSEAYGLIATAMQQGAARVEPATAGTFAATY